jgi:hypothetical protein
VDLFTDADLFIKFLLKPVNGGLNLGTCNSIRGLKLKQDRGSRTDQCPHFFGVIHKRRLARMKENPDCNQHSDNDSEGEVVVQFWLIGKQNQPGGENQPGGNGNNRIFPKQWGHNNFQWLQKFRSSNFGNLCAKRQMSCDVCDCSHFDNSIEFFYNRATCPLTYLLGLGSSWDKIK